MKRSRLNSGWSFGLALSALALLCSLLPQSASAQAPAVGTISSMLANPSCALCGTTERQIQLSAKLRF